MKDTDMVFTHDAVTQMIKEAIPKYITEEGLKLFNLKNVQFKFYNSEREELGDVRMEVILPGKE